MTMLASALVAAPTKAVRKALPIASIAAVRKLTGMLSTQSRTRTMSIVRKMRQRAPLVSAALRLNASRIPIFSWT